ncbi:hypothetical protein HYU22_02555 [Candidatus Woesearchaeota archaeon]|nr:hypothetical protein [Candidatus Woesearchaeota archaeon]
MKNDVQLEAMVRYLQREVPHYLQDGVRDVKPAGDFEYDLGEGLVAKIRVYEVQLNSGKKVFAAEGGFVGSIKNVYHQELPDAETASKVHIYADAALKGLRGKDLTEVAEWLELPEQFRRTD